MNTKIKSKHAIVAKAPYMLYMAFVDPRNFIAYLPEDKKEGVTADYDSLEATVQGFKVGIRVVERTPYSRIIYKDAGAPFEFEITLHFDAAGGDPDKTDFSVEVDAELNLMMKMMLGSKIQDALDKMVSSLAEMVEKGTVDGKPVDLSGFKF